MLEKVKQEEEGPTEDEVIWMASFDSMNLSLSNSGDGEGRELQHAAVHGLSQTQLSEQTTTNQGTNGGFLG